MNHSDRVVDARTRRMMNQPTCGEHSWECELLDNRRIDVWLLSLHAPDDLVRLGWEILAADERARAGRFSFKRLSDEFTIARAALRMLLARYSGVDARKLEFYYGRRGKPSIAHVCPALRFNMSHSRGFAIYAIASECELGIDLEEIRSMHDLEEIAARFFCPEEYADLLCLSPSARRAAFFRCWTRKEAFLKALGDGLSFGLNRFRVTIRPDEPARLLHVEGSAVTACQWSLYDIAVEPGFSCCLVYKGESRTVNYRPAPACAAEFHQLLR